MKLLYFSSISVLALLTLASWTVLQFPAAHLSQSSNLQSQPDPGIEARIEKAYGKLPLVFEANQGQMDRRVKFLSRGSGYSLSLTATGAVLSVSRTAAASSGKEGPTIAEAKNVQATTLRMELAGANSAAPITGLEELPGKVNYFIGNDPKKWRTNIATYAKVKYKDVYPGVDLIYYGNQQQLEYDLVVAPGADPDTIGLRFEGADTVEVDAEGNLVVHAAGGALIQRAPNIYQEIDGVRKAVGGGYVLGEIADRKYRKSQIESPTPHSAFRAPHFVVSFELASYDATKPLVIDPVLVYSTYLGGSADEQYTGIAVDSSGNTYIIGTTNSSNFPVRAGAPQTSLGGGERDVFVAKLNATGTTLLYSTYLGGGGLDRSLSGSIAVDTSGNAYVTGETSSTNFPTTPGVFQTTYNGGLQDVFVVKLSTTGTALLYSTYLGASGGERGFGIAVDSAGNAYVTGTTFSDDFPTTPGVLQRVIGGANDVFITKLNATGNALVYSLFLASISTVLPIA